MLCKTGGSGSHKAIRGSQCIHGYGGGLLVAIKNWGEHEEQN